MNEKDKSLTSLKEIISKLLGESDLPFNPDDARLWEIWDEAVGPIIADHAQPSWVKDGKLRVNVSDSVWLQELEFVGTKIMEKINSRLGRIAVSKIEFRLGEIQNSSG
jgi:predicted nucleic acid-binding Zn ribbon protein